MNKNIFILFLIILTSSFSWSQKRAITFEDMFTMKRLSDPNISPNGKKVVFSVKTYDIEKNSGQSDLYILDLKTNEVKQLTQTPYSELNPRWSPVGNELAFLSTKNGISQIYKINLNELSEPVLAATIPVDVNSFEWIDDGSGFIFNADILSSSQNIYDSSKKLSEKSASPVKAHSSEKLFYRSWNHWRDGIRSHYFQYRFADQTIKDLTPGDIDSPPLDLGGHVDFAFHPGKNEYIFTANMTSSPAENTNNDLFFVSENKKPINLTASNKANDNSPVFSPNFKYLAYKRMTRAGFEADQYQLILRDLKTNAEINVTENLDLTISEFHWAPNSKSIYFVSPYHGAHRLYKVSIKGKLTLLSEGNYLGSFSVAPNNKYIIAEKQSVNSPKELYKFDLKKKRWVRLTSFNKSKVEQLEMPPLESFWVESKIGDSIHVVMLKPPFFDPDKKYPLVVLIHGGPQGAFGDDFHYRWNMEMFAAPGYVVIAPNFHGSRGYGQKFCDAVSKDWGGLPYDDIIRSTQFAVKKYDFIDGNKIGAAGASYGGFMINWLEGHNPDGLFKCLISHAGVFDQTSMYGATEELWFPQWEFNGTPYENPELYKKFSPSSYVVNFNTPCLVITGEKDYRVPYTQSLQMFTALQKRKVPSKLIVFPDEDHFVRKPQNAKYWWENIYSWFENYLK